MVLQYKILRELTLAAGLWLSASAALAGPQSGQDMPLGASSLPPRGYVAFCERKPLDCGEDARGVLISARLADAEIDQFGAGAGGSHADVAATGAHGPLPPPAPLAGATAPEGPASLGAELATSGVIRANIAVQVTFVPPGSPRDRISDEARLSMSRDLWNALKRVNREVNDAMIPASDRQVYGVADFWNTPLEDGARAGDCEDYVLEKRRALLAAGLPRQALNIAIAITSRGESHAVLLVTTDEGEYVLDSLSPWVTPWRETPYLWVTRQVDGESFHWRRVDPAANAPPPAAPRLLIALLH